MNVRVFVFCTFSLLMSFWLTGIFFKNSNAIYKDLSLDISYPTPVVILTYARSGSTFLGEIFRQSMDVFYLFEPLHFLYNVRYNLTYYESTKRLSDTKLPETKHILHNILTCKFTKLPLEFWRGDFRYKYSFQFQRFFEKNRKEIKQRYSRHTDFKNVITDLENECKKAKVIVIKTIRTPMFVLSDLISSRSDTKIIHLIRDPRPTSLSQSKYILHIRTPPDYIRNLCGRMLSDISAGDMLSAVFQTKNIVRLKYENIAVHPVEMTKLLYNFVGIKLHESIINQVELMTSSGQSQVGPLSTVKGNSSAQVDIWRKKARFRFVQIVDNACGVLYKIMGYLPVENELILNDTSVRLFFNLQEEHQKFSYLQNYPIGMMTSEIMLESVESEL